MPKWNFHYLCNAKKSKQKSSMPMCKGTNNISEIGKYFSFFCNLVENVYPNILKKLILLTDAVFN